MIREYLDAMRARATARVACQQAHAELRDSVARVDGVCQAHPLLAVASAAAIGFVLAELRLGQGMLQAGLRVAVGPAWRLLRQFVE